MRKQAGEQKNLEWNLHSFQAFFDEATNFRAKSNRINKGVASALVWG